MTALNFHLYSDFIEHLEANINEINALSVSWHNALICAKLVDWNSMG